MNNTLDFGHYFIIAFVCVYGVFRCYLDSLHAKNVESIDQHLKEINQRIFLKLKAVHWWIEWNLL